MLIINLGQCVAATNSSALAQIPICNRDKIIMTYGDRLRRWIVVRLSPNFQHVDVARFHKFSDAEGYQQTISRLNPAETYEIMFDSADLTPKSINLNLPGKT